MKKIFAYDLDGTLLTHEEVAHPETLKALKLIKEKGHINVIATGRGLMHILPLFETNAVDNIDYLICSNGALIYNMHTKTYEVISSLSPDVFEIILDKFKKYSSILRIDSIDKNQTLLPNGKVPSWLTESKVTDKNFTNAVTEEQIRQQVFDPNSVITQIALRNTFSDAQKVSSELAHELRNHDCEVYLTNSVYTDVNGKNSSKFNALKVLAKELDIDIKNTVAFGDSGNDVQMLKGAGIGVAMGNATPEAKEVAVTTIGHHNTGAIGEYLMELLNKMS